jgi:hypothetical protein
VVRVLLLGALLLLPAAAQAMLIQYEFGGVVVVDTVFGSVPGARFSGRLVYDLSPTSATVFGDLSGDYLWNPPHDPRIGIDALHISSRVLAADPDSSFRIGIGNATANPPFDIFTARAFVMDLDTSARSPLTLTLMDRSDSAFSDVSLPATIDLADFAFAQLSIPVGFRQETPFRGTIDTWRLVPEPSTGLLLAAGLVGLGVGRQWTQTA